MRADDVETALWCVAAAGAFAVWQGVSWLSARGRWQSARERGIHLPCPRLMEGPAAFLADLAPIFLGLLQMAATAALLFFAIFAIGFPITYRYGPLAGVSAGLVVFATGAALGIATLVRLGELRRREVERAARQEAVAAAE